MSDRLLTLLEGACEHGNVKTFNYYYDIVKKYESYRDKIKHIINYASIGNGEKRNHIIILEELLKRGYNVNNIHNEGTPLHYAIKNGFYKVDNNYEIVVFLVENKADVNIKNKEGKTCLDLIKEYQNDNKIIDIIRLLIEHGAVSEC